MSAAGGAPLPKAHQLRAITSPEVPHHSTLIGVAFTASDYALYGVGAALAVLAPWWTVKVVGVAIAGLAAAMLFALGHDAAHGALAASRGANRILATICFLPSWYIYTPWIRGHNHLHHGWTNVAECDYSWRPVSPADYLAMPQWRRLVERAYRAWWGIWVHSIVEIWWKHMAMPREDDRRYLNRRQLDADRLIIAGCVLGYAAFCALVVARWSTLLGGPALSGTAVVVMLVVVPWWIFHVFFGVVTFLHHTHPRVPWYRTKQESNFFAGQVRATVLVKLPTVAERLLHNINVHGAHHVDPRVPFLDLPDAQQRLHDHFTDDIVVERWSLAYLIATTRRCEVYDYDQRQWVRFRDAARVAQFCPAPAVAGTVAGGAGTIAAGSGQLPS